LSICKSIIKKHGGRIWIDSEGKNKGTTVYFTLPAKEKILSNKSII
jgi:signal transduction histidine kinase